MAITGVKVCLDGQTENVIIVVRKALRRAGKDKIAEQFQRAVVSGDKPMMTVVKQYVEIV